MGTVSFRQLLLKVLKLKLRTFLTILIAFVAVFAVNANEAEAAWKFVVYGDTRSDDSAHRSVLSSIAQNTPDYRFIINVGDVIDNLASNVACFITAAAQHPKTTGSLNPSHDIGGRQLILAFLLLVAVAVGRKFKSLKALKPAAKTLGAG